MWRQTKLRLKPYSRGFHLITDEINHHVTDIAQFKIGLMHAFLMHTSAALTINENADPTVRGDFERFFNHAVPENQPYYRHTLEGSDDMPAHLKSSILGASIQVPVSNGKLNLGTWQGIYLCEHRDHAAGRTIIITLNGEPYNLE